MTKKTYAELDNENINLLNKINSLNSKIAKNNKSMYVLEKQKITEIKHEFFKKKSSVKISITNAFELNVMTDLARSDPEKFIKKYLKQYKPRPQYMNCGRMLAYNVATGRGKTKRLFISGEAYNAPHNDFTTAVKGITINASEHDGGPYDRNSHDASIKLRFGSEQRELKYDNNDAAWIIYRILEEYNLANHK